MQESFDVSASGSSYRVVIGSDLVTDVVSRYPSAIFLVDDFFGTSLPIPQGKQIQIKAAESNKSLECIPEVILKLRELGANRATHLVAIGGGVIQDIATFSASVFMRGISWTYMPTTLLGMADSCIGGKSSINVLGFKNLVGNIYPPKEVLIDVNFVASLDAEKVVGGLFEAVKICYARSNDDFQTYLSECEGAQNAASDIQRVITRALRTKKWFIEIDEFDKKERLLLNFGHTFGHAVEAGTAFAVSHGVAVGLGMMVAIEYAKSRNWLSSAGLERTEKLRSYVRKMIGIGGESIVQPPKEISLSKIMEKFNNDKKHLTDVYRIVCPFHDGDLQLLSEAKSDEVRATIVSAYESVFRTFAWPVAV